MHIDWWTLALQTVNVLILIWILSRFFFHPVMNIVASRQAEVNRMLSEAAAARDEAAAARTEAEKARGDIGTERDRIVAAARKSAETERVDLIAQASQDVARLRNDAIVALARDREAAATAVAAHARDLSVEIASRLLARFPPDMAFTAFLDGLCGEVRALPAAAKAGLCEAGGPPIEVVTSAPLPAEQENRVRGDLGRAFGSEVPLAFHADAALIAGIELRGPGTIVRNNWRADLDRIAEEMKRDGHRAGS